MRKRRLAALALAAALLTGCAAGERGTSSGASSGAVSGGEDRSESAAPAGVEIWVDWSRLEGEGERAAPQADVDGGRWYPEYTDHLIPGGGYGGLVPYIGADAYSFETWTDSSGGEHIWYSSWPTHLYGLMTREGKVVVDPVYLSAEQAGYYWQGERETLPVLILGQADEAWGEFNNGCRYAAAAIDGSWCTGFDFWNYAVRGDKVLFYGPEGVTQIDSGDGARRDWSWASLDVTEAEMPQIQEAVAWLYGSLWTDAGVYLGEQTTQESGADWEDCLIRVFRPEDGEVVWMPRQEWEVWVDQQYNWWIPDQWQIDRDSDQITAWRDGESYTLTAPQSGESLSFETGGPFAYLCDFSGDQPKCWLYRLSDGELLLEGEDISFLPDWRGEENVYVLVQDSGGNATVYTPELRPLLTLPSGDWTYASLEDGLLTLWDDGTFFTCYDVERETYIFYRNLSLED